MCVAWVFCVFFFCVISIQNDQKRLPKQNKTKQNKNRKVKDLKGVDMWALGVVAYVLLNHCLPWYNKELTPKQHAAWISKGEIKWRRKNLSENAKDFVISLLTVDKDLRLDARQALMHPWIRSYKILTQ